jgi:hypothetical protein
LSASHCCTAIASFVRRPARPASAPVSSGREHAGRAKAKHRVRCTADRAAPGLGRRVDMGHFVVSHRRSVSAPGGFSKPRASRCALIWSPRSAISGVTARASSAPACCFQSASHEQRHWPKLAASGSGKSPARMTKRAVRLGELGPAIRRRAFRRSQPSRPRRQARSAEPPTPTSANKPTLRRLVAIEKMRCGGRHRAGGQREGWHLGAGPQQRGDRREDSVPSGPDDTTAAGGAECARHRAGSGGRPIASAVSFFAKVSELAPSACRQRCRRRCSSARFPL